MKSESLSKEDNGLRKWIIDYRRIMKDEVSSEEVIIKRIRYIEALCKRVIDEELDKNGKS